MEYYNNILCISGGDLIQKDGFNGGIITLSTYRNLKNRNQIQTIRRACYGKSALYDYESLPTKYKSLIIEKYGDPKDKADTKPFRDSIEPDPEALEFFSSFRLEDGRYLPEKNRTEYCNDAAILNALKVVIFKMQSKRSALGGTMKKFWTKALKAVNSLRDEYQTSLPTSEKRLKERYNAYLSDGYEALISKKFCNNNSRKVTMQLEKLILSLYSMPNKPYSTSVHEMYSQFINGEIQVYDQETGELFKREDYTKNGKPLEISESTVYNYINNALNRITVDAKRSTSLEFKSTHRPHHHRHAPQFSFSKISMDDRDLVHRLHDGSRVKAYFAYDVTSGCVIGKAYSRDKDRALFVECIRDMFRLINKNDFGVPQEVEVENHLVNKFSDGLMKAGLVFPFVRWCNPGNSQEKRAEHFNRQMKYGVEKKLQSGIGRPFAQLEANRVRLEYGAKPKTFSFAQVVADHQEVIKAYNNQLHPDQKKYPGMTRWQVLCEFVNPNLAKIDDAILYRYIGERTTTSFRHSQYCQLQGAKYQIKDPKELEYVLKRLQPHNLNVEAYWLADSEGIVHEAYLYQNDEFVCKVTKIPTYNEATAEQTDADIEAYNEQAKYVSHFDKMVKQGKKDLYVPGIIETSEFEDLDNVEVEVVDTSFMNETEDFEAAELYDEYSEESMRKRALESL